MHITTRPSRRNRHHRNHNFFAPSFGNIINEIFHNSLGDVEVERPKTYSRPAANVEKVDGSYILSVALPGVSREEVQINIDKNKLTIKSAIEENTDTKYKLREFNYAKFERAFKLSENADIDNISAKFDKGILAITIPTIKEAGPTEIKIS